jgi:hypothetical protein
MPYPFLFLWQASKTLQMVQFPWRLLGLFSFGIASLITAIAFSNSSNNFNNKN